MGKRSPAVRTRREKSLRQEPVLRSSAPSRPWRVRGFYLFIILLCIGIYGRTATFKTTGLNDGKLIETFAGHHYRLVDALVSDCWMKPHGGTFYRPLQSVSFILDAAISQGSPVAYHCSNFILHCLTICCFLYLLLLLGFDRRLSLSAALLFAVHPLFVNAVAWVPARGDLLLGLFAIFSLAALEKFRRTLKSRWLALHGSAFVLAILSKESAVVLPLLFAAYMMFFDRRGALSRALMRPAPIWIFTDAIYLFLRHAAIGSSGQIFGLEPLIDNLRTLPETFAALFLCFDIPVLPGFAPAPTVIGLLAGAGIIITLGAQKKLRRPAVIFGALWFILLSIPGMMYRHEYGSHAFDYLNHRTYLPIVGIFMVFAEAVPAAWYAKRRHSFVAAASCIISVLCILAWRQCGYFATAPVFFDQAIRTNPESAIARLGRGLTRRNGGDNRGAILDFDHAIHLFPGYFWAYFFRGKSKGDLGDIPGAIADLEKAVELNPKEAWAFNDLGLWKDSAHDIRGALAAYDRSIELNPLWASPYYNRANLRAESGDNQGALHDYAESIRLDPGYAMAYNNRGNCRGGMGDVAGAIADLTKAVLINSTDAGAYCNLGGWKAIAGDTGGAMAAYTRSARLNPRFPRVFNNRGSLFAERRNFDQAAADFQTAIRLYPFFTDAMVNLGRVKFQLGDVAGACDLWRKAKLLGDKQAMSLAGQHCR